MVRVTHWITAVAFVALLLTGAEIVVSHPRFYWGETGSSVTQAWLTIPIPSSRGTVPTGYGYVMPDQNGWSRYLHFEAAWVAVLTGLVYVFAGLGMGHFRRNLAPAKGERSWQALWGVVAGYLRRAPPAGSANDRYNPLQKVTYLAVIFVLFPLVIWTGLALSPGWDSAFPATVNLLGGRQSARTLHFLISALLLLFFAVHVAMVAATGFRSRTRAMITGRTRAPEERG